MRILNLGSRTGKMYFLELATGWMLVDTGYEQQLPGFAKRLSKHGMAPADIRVVFSPTHTMATRWF